jgi:small-conductance mechanosensitive channel
MNDYLNQTNDALSDSYRSLVDSAINAIPELIQAIVLLIIGLLIASTLENVTRKILSYLQFDKLTDRAGLNKLLKNTPLDHHATGIIAKAVYWIVLLTFLLAISSVLGLDGVTNTLETLISYIPNIIAAVIVLIITLAVGTLLKTIVTAAINSTSSGSEFGGIVGTTAQIAVIAFGIVIAISQLGLNVDIITNNITIIVAGVTFGIALAIGWGSKNLAENFLSGYFTKQNFTKGQKVRFKSYTGTVKKMNTLGMVLDTPEGEMFIPHKEIVN